MAVSMTGFGRAEYSGPSLRVDVEVRSVNHRYLKVNLKAPPELSEHEAELEARIRKRVSRGNIDALVKVDRPQAATAYELDERAVTDHFRRLSAIAARLSIDRPRDLTALTHLPGVFRPVERSPLSSSETRRVLTTVDTALKALVATRGDEGARLADAIREHVEVLRQHVDVIAALSPKVLEEHHEKLTRRVRNLLMKEPDVTVQKSDLAREVALIADRCDISEELARLRSHLKHLATMLKRQRGNLGRELDFTVQEMFREINTIGAKGSHPEVSRRVVAVKVEIEKIREQVQNIE